MRAWKTQHGRLRLYLKLEPRMCSTCFKGNFREESFLAELRPRGCHLLQVRTTVRCIKNRIIWSIIRQCEYEGDSCPGWFAAIMYSCSWNCNFNVNSRPRDLLRESLSRNITDNSPNLTEISRNIFRLRNIRTRHLNLQGTVCRPVFGTFLGMFFLSKYACTIQNSPQGTSHLSENSTEFPGMCFVFKKCPHHTKIPKGLPYFQSRSHSFPENC